KRILIQNNEKDSDDETESDTNEIMEPRPPRPYSCCGEVWCSCELNETIAYNHEEYEEIAQENESYYFEKHAEDIISHYSYDPDELYKNPNGWELEYYDMETYEDPEAYNATLNESWGMPDLNNEIEQQIDEVWGIWTIAWTYDRNEVTRLMNDITETKWV